MPVASGAARHTARSRAEPPGAGAFVSSTALGAESADRTQVYTSTEARPIPSRKESVGTPRQKKKARSHHLRRLGVTRQGRKRKGSAKRSKRRRKVGTPVVAIVAKRIARELKRAGVSREELFEGLREERARLFRERYSDCSGGNEG